MNDLRSGKCCLIMGSVSASAQDMEMKMHNIQWIFFSVKEERRTRGHGNTLAKKQCTKYHCKGKGLRVNN